MGQYMISASVVLPDIPGRSKWDRGLSGFRSTKAPRGDACDKADVDFAVGDADAVLAVGVCAVQLARKVRNRLGTGAKPNVVLVGGKVDEVAPLPVGGHAPGDFLLSIGEGGTQTVSNLVELRPHLHSLPGDVFADGEGLLAAGVGLVVAGKLTSTLGAFPHEVSYCLLCLIPNPGAVRTFENGLASDNKDNTPDNKLDNNLRNLARKKHVDGGAADVERHDDD